jgi:hypothetical protein
MPATLLFVAFKTALKLNVFPFKDKVFYMAIEDSCPTTKLEENPYESTGDS